VKLLLKNLLFTILVPGTVAVYVPLYISHSIKTTSQSALLVVGVLLFAIGTAIYAWTVWDIATKGGGTPLPLDAPRKLVVCGLYQYTRNPMYLGVITVILGWVVIFSTIRLLIYALIVWIAIYLFVMLYEEPKLKELFGPEYDTYKSGVARWLPLPQKKKTGNNRQNW
jgi:protein-S-isoprenylcysteine O-methyltransferase Ste14